MEDKYPRNVLELGWEWKIQPQNVQFSGKSNAEIDIQCGKVSLKNDLMMLSGQTA